MAFCVYRSNRVENLAEALAGVVQEPLRSPFERECIVVQGPGMERWLAARLAARLSVWANPWFPFPRAVIELALDAALGPVAEEERLFEPEPLAFSIARALDAELSEPAFAEVARYLEGDRHHEARLSLAALLARTYDQYLVFRPDLVLSWERGAADHFQSRLWRTLTRSAPRTHVARRMEDFALAMRAGARLERGSAPLPERISLFGISTLPPAFLGVLTQLAEHVDVHLFLLTPSPHYWGDFDKRLARGNSVCSLLANLGKVSRDFVELLLDGTGFAEPLPELFELPPPRSLLTHLQRDVAELRERTPGLGGEQGPLAVSKQDRSIVVHACHSAMRELEVLRDELRARFESDKTLEARDVVVFAPDIERYVPVIEAVFSQRDEDGRAAIPYRIADRKATRSSELVEAFLALLDLVRSRLLLSDVLDFLHRAPVRARFGIEESELELVQHWLVEAGARWAVDAAHRASFHQPAYEQNSFRFALHRLLVGYAAADGERRDLHGVLPYSDIEGEHAELLGRVTRFAETLFALVQELAAPRSVESWSRQLIEALSRSLSDDAELGYEHQGLRSTLANLARDARVSDFDAPVSLGAIRTLLEERADRGRANLGFLSSGVTFCEHVPMRAIPFRVVCMIGMDDESFPRRAPRPSFDVMSDEERRGDRNLRDDDRQLFLEALLSARDAVIITYVGRSAKDDSERPASVLVEQLLRVIDRHFVLKGENESLWLPLDEGSSTASSLTCVHALHRFDARYFGAHDPRYFSYDATAAKAAVALRAPAGPPAPFVERPLPPRELRSITLDELVRFYRSPQRAFVRERLRVRLPEASSEVPDREATGLDALARYKLHDRLLNEPDQLDLAESKRVLSLEGKLPPGTPGELWFDDLAANVRAMRGAVSEGERLPDRALHLELAGVVLSGRLTGLHERARVEYTAASAQGKHKLSAWIRHLALCATGASPQRSLLVSRNGSKKGNTVKVFAFRPVPAAAARLTELVELYLLGMRMPLPLLCEPALAYLKELDKSGDAQQALRKAAANLRDPGLFGGSQDDRYVRQVWSPEQLEELGSLTGSDGSRQVDFAELAERVLRPLAEHLSEERS